MKKLLPLFLLAVIVLGCASSSTMSPTAYRTRTFTSSYAATFESAVDYLSERGYRITKSDLAAGIIETDYREGAGWAEAFPGDKRAKVRGEVVQISEQEAKLILTITCEERDQYSGWQEVTMDVGKELIYYKNFFDSIQARAKLKTK